VITAGSGPVEIYIVYWNSDRSEFGGNARGGERLKMDVKKRNVELAVARRRRARSQIIAE